MALTTIPISKSANAWDAIDAVFHTIKKLDGKFDADTFVNEIKHWKASGPRGKISIDPETRDIVNDEHAMEVIRKPDGKLGTKRFSAPSARSRILARNSRLVAAALHSRQCLRSVVEHHPAISLQMISTMMYAHKKM